MASHKPLYHFGPPAHWMNDPNGLIQWQGTYHLFYQYNPAGPFHATIHWGHATSPDLVHWAHQPVALTPTPGGPDAAGCWSGCAIDHDGTPTLMYTGVTLPPGTERLREAQCLATSADDLLTWTPSPASPVIPAPPPDLAVVGFRDPFVWREGAGWACVVGAGIVGEGGTILLYRSPDLVHWTYHGPLWVGDARVIDPVWTGTMWECPQFFPLGDRHVLIFSVWDAGKTNHTAYAVGEYDGRSFRPTLVRRFDLGPDYYAPAVLRDDHGRLLVWGWLREARRKAAQLEAGWSGVMSAPRVLTLGDDDQLRVAPIPELQTLRRTHHAWHDLDLRADLEPPQLDVRGACLEIVATFAMQADALVGLRVFCSPDGQEYTTLLYNAITKTVTVDRDHASLAPTSYRGVDEGQVAVPDGEPVTLHILLDHTIVEVYLNQRACFSERVYPTLPESLGVALLVPRGRAHLVSLDVWELAAAR